MIISSGMNISPVELEATIGLLDEAAVIAHCNKLLSDYKVPLFVVIRCQEVRPPGVRRCR